MPERSVQSCNRHDIGVVILHGCIGRLWLPGYVDFAIFHGFRSAQAPGVPVIPPL